MSEAFLNGRITLHCGDNREVLKGIPDCSIDSIVTDPPYALVSITKRFGGKNAAGVKVPEGGSGAYARASAGFMGKQWDTGETAFATEFWAEVLRVLKPGAHLVAFGASRGYHRMACAIEDAGFEIRDSLMWLYGTGFPKSHDVSKGIDKLDAVEARRERQFRFTAWMRSTGLTASRIDEITGTNMGGHYTTAASQPAIATRDLFEMLRPHFSCDVPDWVEKMVDERTVESENFKRREVLARSENGIAGGSGEFVTGNDRSAGYAAEFDVTRAFSPEAAEWEGWGTALKPAFEPIVLARKPLSEGTVAANVLRWRTGALNIDACRIGTEGGSKHVPGTGGFDAGTVNALGGHLNSVRSPAVPGLGRWPANVCHDGSDEVVAGFPNTTPSKRNTKPAEQYKANGKNDVYGAGMGGGYHAGFDDQGNGSAARFFYSAKASKADRAGSKHPTVKPVSLMEWLCALVTPPGGTVLDPFAGSGTTGVAARAKGFNAILIEREEEYQADIRRRMALCLAGPEERARESIKAKLKDRPVDAGPLFSGSDTPPQPVGKYHGHKSKFYVGPPVGQSGRSD